MNKSTLLLAAVPCIALAAEETAQQLARDGATTAFWFMLLATQVVILVGHAASSLGKWAQWHDPSGTEQETIERRYALAQKLCVSIFAGNIAYLGGLYIITADQVQSIISAGVASWGGDKFLAPLLGRITAVFQVPREG